MVIKLGKEIDVPLQASEFVACHIIIKKIGDPAIIAKLANRKNKELMMKNRKKLKDKTVGGFGFACNDNVSTENKMFINESLTQANKEFFLCSSNQSQNRWFEAFLDKKR